MDPDIQLQIKVDVLGLETVRNLHREMEKLVATGDRVARRNQDNVGVWETLRKALDQIEQKYDAVFRAGFRLQNLGADLNRIGQFGTKVLKDSVNQWGDFEFALNRAAGALEIFSTNSKIYGQLKQAIYEAAQEARIFPAEEVARAAYYWGSTTGQVVETYADLKVLMGGLVPIMKAAAITETQLETAIKGTYSILQQYRMGLEETEYVTEVLMLLTQKTAAEFPDLINSFKMVGPIANSLGISFEEVATYLGLLADAGIKGTMSGRALRQTFIKLTDPSVKARKELDALMESTFGVGETFSSIVFPKGEFIGFTQYINILAKATEDLTQEERNHLLGVITTANEMPAITALIDRQIEARKGNKNAIDDEKFSLRDAHKQFEDTFNLLKNSWQGITGLWENSVIPIIHLVGAEVAKMAAPVLEAFSEIAQSVYKWLETNPAITEWIVRILGVASAAFVVAGAFFAVLGTLLVFGAGVGLAVESMVLFWRAASGAVLATDETGKAIARFGIMVGKTFTPVTAIISRFFSLFSLLMVAIVTDFGGVRGALGSLADLTIEVVKYIGGAATQAARVFDFFGQAVGFVVGALDELFGALGKINFSESKFVFDLSGALYFLVGAVQDVAGTLLGLILIVKTASAGWALLTSAVLAIKNAYIGLLALRGVLMAFWAAHVSGSLAAAGASTVAAGAVGLLSKAFTFLLAHPVVLAIVAITAAVAGAVAAFTVFGDIVNNFAMDFGDMGDRIHQVAENTGQSYQQVKDAIQQHMRETGESFLEAANEAEAYGLRVIEGGRQGEQAIVESTARTQAELETTANAIGMTGEAFATLPPETQEAMAGMVAATQEGAAAVTESLDDITVWADSVVGQLQIAAQQGRLEARVIPSEIAAGILEGRNDVVNAAKGLADAATYELMNEARVGEIRVQMGDAAQAIQDAITEGTPGAVAAAQASYIALELELAGYLLTIDPMSKEAAGILEKYINDSDEGVQAAARDLYGALEDKAFTAKHNIEQYAVDMGIAPERALKLFKAGAILQADLLAQGIETPIEELVGQLQTHGTDASKALATAIRDNAYLAGTATGETKREAEENLKILKELAEAYGYDVSSEFAQGIKDAHWKVKQDAEYVAARARVGLKDSQDWYAGGSNVGIAWANGLRSAADYANLMGWEVAASASRALRGLSPPKEGPLRDVDKGAWRIGHAWALGLSDAAPMAALHAARLARAAKRELMSAFDNPLPVLSELGSVQSQFGFRIETENRKQIDLNVNVTSSDRSVSNDNARQIATGIEKVLMLDNLEHMVTVS